MAGVDLVLNPTVSLMFQNLNMLSPGGKCRSFDAEGKRATRAMIYIHMHSGKNPYSRV